MANLARKELKTKTTKAPRPPIPRPVESMLWGRAAGRCEFRGCNRPVYKSGVTQEAVNVAEKAHIRAFSKAGPRGGPAGDGDVDSIDNLMLVCHDCHAKIDKNVDRYPDALLREMKAEHERRISVVTAIDPQRQSTVLMYGASIGAENSPIDRVLAQSAMFPARYPATEDPIVVSMRWEGRDDDPAYWDTQATDLRKGFERNVRPRIEEVKHWSVFGFAPMPLLMLLGTLLTEKVNADIYQLRREPTMRWAWDDDPVDTEFRIVPPRRVAGRPALVVSLSARIDHRRVHDAVGDDVAIWELTIEEPHNDFLVSAAQLSGFRGAARKAIGDIAEAHGHAAPLMIFPAMPVATAVELGRIRMPKADCLWEIFDYQQKRNGFVRAITI